MTELRKRSSALPDEYLITFVGARLPGPRPPLARRRAVHAHLQGASSTRMSAPSCRPPGIHADPPHPLCRSVPPGDMITEEALPTYMAMLNTLDGVRD